MRRSGRRWRCERGGHRRSGATDRGARFAAARPGCIRRAALPRQHAVAAAVRAMNNSRRLSVSAVIGAMGIVYGDIGTSPLYALQSALDAAGGFDAEVVLGVLSLVFWSLAISVTLKYVTVIMRADNEGEGGILALFALAQRRLITGSTWAKVAVALALIGTAFFFCDALILPPLSVPVPVEGSEVLNRGLQGDLDPGPRVVDAGRSGEPRPRAS